MKLAAFYAAICLAALIASAVVQLGWQPDFVAVWDARSREILTWLLLIATLLGAAGLSETLPTFDLPKRLKAVPAAITVLLPIVLTLGLLELSPDSNGAQVFTVLLKWGGAAVVMGLVTGIMQSFEAKLEVAEPSATKGRHTFLVGSIAVVLIGGALLLSQTRARDDGKTEEFARLGTPSLHLVIGLWTAPLWGDSYGVVRIHGTEESNGLILERTEWPAFAALWTKARNVRSGEWVMAGEMNETVISDRATVQVSGGPGVRFRISSPHSPTMIYDVTPSDIPRLDSAIAKTGARLGP